MATAVLTSGAYLNTYSGSGPDSGPAVQVQVRTLSPDLNPSLHIMCTRIFFLRGRGDGAYKIACYELTCAVKNTCKLYTASVNTKCFLSQCKFHCLWKVLNGLEQKKEYK